MKIEINKLQSHPYNRMIYGYEENNELLERIRSSGWIKPILITPNFTILSGHRRVDCCKTLGISEVECEIIEGDPVKYLEIMLSENQYRVKTTFQLLKESEIYCDLEKQKAYKRQKQAEKIESALDLVETFPQGQTVGGGNLPPLAEKGRTRDIVAEKIGMSGRTYDKGKKVMKRIEEEEDPTLKEFFGAALNENIDATAKLIEKPYGTIREIKDRTYIDLKNLGKVVREVDQKELAQNTHLPPGKYQVIYGDLSNHPTENLTKLPISALGEDNSVLFLWTTPTTLGQTIALINNWGFQYKTCFVWYKDVFEVSDKAEILTVSTRGQPPMIKLSEESAVKTVKPELVKQMMDTIYTGSKVELTFGNSAIEEWTLWD